MMILIPVMSYAGAVLLVDENYRQGWLPMPRELARTIEIPMLGGVPNLLAYLMVTLVLCLIGFGVFVTLYSFVYRLFEPTHLGPLDAEPVTRAERRAYARRQAAVYKKHK